MRDIIDDTDGIRTRALLRGEELESPALDHSATVSLFIYLSLINFE